MNVTALQLNQAIEKGWRFSAISGPTADMKPVLILLPPKDDPRHGQIELGKDAFCAYLYVPSYITESK